MWLPLFCFSICLILLMFFNTIFYFLLARMRPLWIKYTTTSQIIVIEYEDDEVNSVYHRWYELMHWNYRMENEIRLMDWGNKNNVCWFEITSDFLFYSSICGQMQSVGDKMIWLCFVLVIVCTSKLDVITSLLLSNRHYNSHILE